MFVVVSGPPASGKSTLAPVLARELGLPLLAKDTIKDALMSVLPVPDVETSRQLGRCSGGNACGRRRIPDRRSDREQLEVAEPVAGGWPVIEMDTNTPVDIAVVLAFVRVTSSDLDGHLDPDRVEVALEAAPELPF